MQLGKETGSFVNHLYAAGTKGQPIPEVGMGVTFLSWTDRHPGTIVDIIEKGKWLIIACTSDSYKRIDNNGMSESQEYEYTSNMDGHKTFYRRLKANPNDRFTGCKVSEKGRWVNNKNSIRIGERQKYYDFSFQEK